MSPDALSQTADNIRLVLGSGSPRRAELLASAGLRFVIYRPDIDETPLLPEIPRDYVARMSDTKYRKSLEAEDSTGTAVVLCADTIVALEGEVLGKPVDRQEGLRMLQRLSDRSHQVFTSVTLGRTLEDYRSFVVETIVRFRTLSQEECETYWDTGEPQDKAGGYGAQGIGSIFIDSIAGSFTNVVGLPMTETVLELRRLGVPVLDTV